VPAIPCPSGLVCVAPPLAAFLTVDEVRDLRVVDGPDGSATVRVTLTPDDADLLAAVAGRRRQADILRVRAADLDQEVPFSAVRDADLSLPVAGAAAGDALVAGLGPATLPAARPGPGPLMTPLELWAVAGEPTPGLCGNTPAPGAAARGLNTALGCLWLREPALRFDAVADLRVLEPDRVGVVPVEADRSRLLAFTTQHTSDRVVVLVGGRLFGGAPEIQGPFSEGFEVVLADRPAAESLVARLRTWPVPTPSPGPS